MLSCSASKKEILQTCSIDVEKEKQMLRNCIEWRWNLRGKGEVFINNLVDIRAWYLKAFQRNILRNILLYHFVTLQSAHFLQFGVLGNSE